ncbi:Csu type fimbrial protein [Pseudoxanthomonas wuyuanensis]|uniref:Spore coat protein U (SCPU) domain-containing protein n=1 Tax=Pseudoxanthomonas wuyuanensis TaxID=1073196 RepID=A0A286DFT8_9GAMM|nr:spore coat U domain-containing protein [Pseudoxanthomonas wuyuanensis]KAF1718980.1 SCPU domain-containing protein [Pseudoxanthomonas wuyuanensis]SOD57508.1 Spore coat protein U (SCPU) domain-containing protein [Pseudoxanthomonas wuyuanensis]
MNASKTRLLIAVLLACGVGAAATASAADTTTFDVTITITATCDIEAAAATDVDFGTVASSAVNIDSSGSLTVNCTPGTAYNIALDSGQNGADADSRAMTDGSVLVPYQLYREAARGAGDVWGSTIGTNTLAGTGDGANQAFPVYGRVPSASFPAGVYADVITATVIY